MALPGRPKDIISFDLLGYVHNEVSILKMADCTIGSLGPRLSPVLISRLRDTCGVELMPYPFREIGHAYSKSISAPMAIHCRVLLAHNRSRQTPHQSSHRREIELHIRVDLISNPD